MLGKANGINDTKGNCSGRRGESKVTSVISNNQVAGNRNGDSSSSKRKSNLMVKSRSLSNNSNSTPNGLEGRRKSVSFNLQKTEYPLPILPEVSALIQFKKNGEIIRELRKIQHVLSNFNNLDDGSLLKFIRGIERDFSILDEKFNPLIQQLLNIDWFLRSSKIIESIRSLIESVLSIRPALCAPMLYSLFSKFFPLASQPRVVGIDTEHFSTLEEAQFNLIHETIVKIFSLIPMSRDQGVKIIGSLYPYVGKDAHIHFAYLKNILHCIDYMKPNKAQIFHIIINKLARIDVNLPKEDVIEFDDKLVNETALRLKKGSKIHNEFYEYSLTSDEPFNPIIQVLDLSMKLLFEFIDYDLTNEEEEEQMETDSGEIMDKVEMTFQYLSTIFEAEIIPTFGISHVQFIVFYVTSIRSSFPTKFLELLWKKFTNPSTSQVIRIQAMSFISGYLSRAKFISIKIVKRWLTVLSSWANAYADEKVSSCHWSSVDVEAHGAFYAVCQTIFYTFAFRNKEIIGSRHCIGFAKTLNLGRLVTCDLNPLKACVPTVASAFVDAAHHHQISYCKTVLDRNQCATIPTATKEFLYDFETNNESVHALNSLECFFPFDPYRLPRSKKWIDPIYKLYEPYLPEVKIEKEETFISDQNEDSIEIEINNSKLDTSLFNLEKPVKSEAICSKKKRAKRRRTSDSITLYPD